LLVVRATLTPKEQDGFMHWVVVRLGVGVDSQIVVVAHVVLFGLSCLSMLASVNSM
jgi:hypothetical protein